MAKMPMIGLRLSEDLRCGIERLAADRRRATGQPVTVTAILREAISAHLAAATVQPVAKSLPTTAATRTRPVAA